MPKDCERFSPRFSSPSDDDALDGRFANLLRWLNDFPSGASGGEDFLNPRLGDSDFLNDVSPNFDLPEERALPSPESFFPKGRDSPGAFRLSRPDLKVFPLEVWREVLDRRPGPDALRLPESLLRLGIGFLGF